MSEFFRTFIPRQPWSGLDIFMIFIFGLIALGVTFLAYLFLAWVCKMIFYEFSYDAVKTYKGEVVNMEYVPPKTTSTWNATTKMMQTSTEPEKNIVIFKTDLKVTEVDSDSLYQRVRIGESVTVKSQTVYAKPRFWEGKWEVDGERLLSVTSEKNQEVEFNDAQPANYRSRL